MAKYNKAQSLEEKGRRAGLIGNAEVNIQEIVETPMNPEILNKFVALMGNKKDKYQPYN